MQSASFAREAIARHYDALDARISKFVFGSLFERFGILLPAQPATRSLPLVASPTPIILSVFLYLLVVGIGLFVISAFRLRPREKESFPLRGIVLLHNLFLCILSAYMSVGIAVEAWRNKYVLWGNPYKPSETKMAFLIYLFYVSKYIEFGDTLIMLVKRNVRQISFLHVYHHASISLIWWSIAYTAPGGEAYFSACLNSLVHVFMYGYYFLASLLGKSNEKLRKKYLFWGRYLTQFQMFQFLLNMCQATLGIIAYPEYPRWLMILLWWYMVSLLALFAHFYVTKYFQSSAGKKEKKQDLGKKED